MPTSSAIQTLLDFGIFNDEAVSRLASLIQHIQSIADETGTTAPKRKRRRKVGKRTRVQRRKKRRRGRTWRAARSKRANRGQRGKFNPSKGELSTMRKTMTIGAIAKKHGVSGFTVHARLTKHGLTGKGTRKAKA